MKRRKIGVLACVTLLLVGAFAIFEYSKSRENGVKVMVSTPQLQSVEIGNYATLDEGQRVAIQELSRQIKLFPKTLHFRVFWETPPQLIDKETAEFFLSYNLKTQFLTWDVTYKPRTKLIWGYPFYRRDVYFAGRDGLYIYPRLTSQEIHRAADLKKTLFVIKARNLIDAGYQ